MLNTEAWADQQPPTLLVLCLFGSATGIRFQSDIDLAIVAKTDANAKCLATSLRDRLEPIAQR